MVTTVDRARDVAASVVDPELPVLTIAELGVLRDVRVCDDGTVEVDITPTYSGCPAMDAIRCDIEKSLHNGGFAAVRVTKVLAPPWSTDWITEAGKEKLHDFGIAPPATVGPAVGPGAVHLALSVRCPHCDSLDTVEISRFGSTACKAIWTCHTCSEPFEAVKPL